MKVFIRRIFMFGLLLIIVASTPSSVTEITRQSDVEVVIMYEMPYGW